MYHSVLCARALILCDDSRRGHAVRAALEQFITPDLMLSTAPSLEAAMVTATDEPIDALLMCGDTDWKRLVEMIFKLRVGGVRKPVLIVMPPASDRQCIPLFDDMAPVECVHFSVVRAGRLSACVHDLCRRHRQAEEFTELTQRCLDLEAENLRLHRQLAELTRGHGGGGLCTPLTARPAAGPPLSGAGRF